MNHAIAPEQLAALCQLDTCSVANAIETFDVRLRNEGFASPELRLLTPRAKPMVGYAATVRIRCSNPPVRGITYPNRTDWWSNLLHIPAPRVVVIQDVDDEPGTGGFLGEVHAHILKALDCAGAVVSGTVRDLPAIEKTGFQIFAKGLAVSHAYVHIVDFGHSVEVGGLTVKAGDLLHADEHGVLSVPPDIAGRIPAVAAAQAERERHVLELCRSKDFNLERLRESVKGIFD